jgi:hypothetical protein
MLERYEIRDERGSVTGYVLKETAHGSSSPGRPPRPRRRESPAVDAICMIVGFIMLAATVALMWVMATAA